MSNGPPKNISIANNAMFTFPEDCLGSKIQAG